MCRDDFALCRAQILIDRDKLDAVNDDTIPLQMLQVAGLAVDIKRIHQFERIGSVILLDEFLNTCVNIDDEKMLLAYHHYTKTDVS